MTPRLLYRDDHVVAVDKPSGMLVHRMSGCSDRDVVVQQVRDRLGQWVYPVHRLDRGTSGVLLLALDSAVASALGTSFRERRVVKRYLALARGWAPPFTRIDAALREDHGGCLPSVTDLRRLSAVELPFAVGRYSTARYCLVELSPRTGRTHQLRRHLAHIRHPIVGDVRHGDGRHNRFFRERHGVRRLMLCATAIELDHPVTGKHLTIEAPPALELQQLWMQLGLRPPSAASDERHDDEPEQPGSRRTLG